MGWLMDNLGTIFVTMVLVAIVTMIILKLVKDRKMGRSSCGCNCGNCKGHAGCGHSGEHYKRGRLEWKNKVGKQSRSQCMD